MERARSSGRDSIVLKRLVLILGTLSFLGAAENPNFPHWTKIDEDVAEAVFRFQFAHNTSTLQGRSSFYCLAVGPLEKSPSDEFMKRFAADVPPVRKKSDCKEEWHVGGLDPNTHTRGLIFKVRAITWRSKTEAEAEGVLFEDIDKGSGSTFTVKKKDGHWTVTKEALHWSDSRRYYETPGVAR